jgi:osmoprotectant transport system ATP-binding protein
MNETPAAFELCGASKRFGPGQGLGRTDLRIAAGQTVALVGPSGSGKSTLLRLLLGLLLPDEGTVSFRGTPLLPSNLETMRQRIGFVVQNGGLFPHLSAERNASILARHLQWSREKISGRLAELAALVKLPRESLSRMPSQLSGGENQRVALMRALMCDPEVLLLDEPLGALDPITRYELQEDLQQIFNQLDKTVIVVTHDLAEAAFFAQRLLLLRQGEIVQDGSLNEFIESPADPFVTRFLKSSRSPSFEKAVPQ